MILREKAVATGGNNDKLRGSRSKGRNGKSLPHPLSFFPPAFLLSVLRFFSLSVPFFDFYKGGE